MRNEKYSMLIKHKTRRTIIVLSPNSANLIKILTQFVYSINILYFSPSSPAVPRSITGCFVQQNIGEVSARTEGLIKQRGWKTAIATKSSITLSLPCHAAI